MPKKPTRAKARPAPKATPKRGATTKKNKFVTLKQMAEIKFEPWKHMPDEWKPPNSKEWSEAAKELLMPAHIAWAIMFKTKEEMVTIAKDIGDENLEGTLKGIINARRFFHNFVVIIDAAETRLMCAVAAAYRGGRGKAP